MKSQLITILSVVGVLGTAGAAMAINSDALSSLPSGSIGGATQVLVPASENKLLVAPDPSTSPTAAPSPAAIPTPAAAGTGGSPSATTPPVTRTEKPEAPRTASPTPKPTYKEDDEEGGDDD